MISGVWLGRKAQSLADQAFHARVAQHQHKAIVNDLRELLGHQIPSANQSPKSDSETPDTPMKYGVSPLKMVCAFTISIGDAVVVQSMVDRSQEDLGDVVRVYSSEHFAAQREEAGPSEEPDENKIGKVLRMAELGDLATLPYKRKQEQPLVQACQTFLASTEIDMAVFGVEYQFDGRVLFVYYTSTSEDRIDFRPLVKHLRTFWTKNTRIYLKKTKCVLAAKY